MSGKVGEFDDWRVATLIIPEIYLSADSHPPKYYIT